MKYSALIVAAGQGTRLNLGYNKIFYKLNNGKTVLDTVLETFFNDEKCQQLVVVLNSQDLYQQSKCQLTGKTVYVLGGKRRQDSVLNGLMAVTEKYVLIHDGARPYLRQELIDSVLNKLEEHQACIPVVALKDTIKKVNNDKAIETLDRSQLAAIQTPQGFHTDVIFNAYLKAEEAKLEVTDDAQVIELTSDIPIATVLGDYNNLKITTEEDLA